VIFGIVLAAGLGRRIGTPKALLTIGGETFHHRAIHAFHHAGLDAVVVVNQTVNDALPPPLPRERRVINPDPDQEGGMFASVRLGLAEATTLGALGAILLPVDHPWITEEDLRSVADQMRNGAAIAVATHADRWGHPIGINREVMDEIESADSAATLRDIVRRDPGRVVEVPVSVGAVLGVNTAEDLERVSNRPFR
jgi:CTP:molybdopterin cytidylyltransferase MocA